MAGSAEVARALQDKITLNIANRVAFSAIERHAVGGMQELAVGLGSFLAVKGMERLIGKNPITKTAEVLSGLPAGTGTAKLLESGVGFLMTTFLSMKADESIRRRLDMALKRNK